MFKGYKNLKWFGVVFGIFLMISGGLLFAKKISLAEFWEDEEDEREERYEDDERENDDDGEEYIAPIQQDRQINTNQSAIQQVIPTQPIQPDYKIKDTDLDGIIDSKDQHPGEDDFIYLVTDKNLNGIVDDLEF